MKTFKNIEKINIINFDNTEIGRLYKTENGNFYPSVTTVISKTLVKDGVLNEWKERVGADEAEKILRKAGLRGSILHEMVENYLYDTNYNILTHPRFNSAPITQFLWAGIHRYLDNIDSIYGLELPLYSDTLKIAGRIDCVSEYNGKLSIIDFKTSRGEKRKEWILNYFIQATLYALMFNENYNKLPSQIVILIANEDGSGNRFIEPTSKYIKPSIRIINEFWKNNKNIYLQSIKNLV